MAQITPAARLAKWKKVEMPIPPGLSPKEHQMVDKLAHACHLLDEIFWRQSDLAGLDLYRTTSDPAIKRLLAIMGSRADLLDENRPFVGGLIPQGHEQYPHDLTRDATFLKKTHGLADAPGECLCLVQAGHDDRELNKRRRP